jgi:hypothetical protein
VQTPVGLRTLAIGIDGQLVESKNGGSPQECRIISAARVAAHVPQPRPANPSAAPHPNSRRLLAPIVRNPMDSVPFRPTVEVIPDPRWRLDKHAGSFGVQLASISGVAASPVLSGQRRRGSERSIVRLLDRLSDLGSGPADRPDERLRSLPVVRQAQLMGSEAAELQAYYPHRISPTDTFRASARPAGGSAC